SFGYASGNEVLKQVARRLAECADQTVTVAKLGGDEFGVFWPHVTDDRAAAELASAIERVFDAPFSVGTVDIGLTPSIGMALTPEDGADVYGLLTNAETATAIVKRGGGNGFRRYSREWGAGSAERIAVEADLRHALERNQLVPKFGPVFRTADKRIAAVELTTSWAHPVRGLLAPDLFMSVADESGYSNGIEDWGLRKACEFGRSLHDAGGGDTCVSVRVSARRLSQPGLLRAISEVTDITGFSPALLEIEISESALVSAAEAGIGVLCALKKFGVKLCVGSSGTGYSSLSIPRRLPIDIVKMNRSLVRDVATDQEAEAVARAILTLSRSLGRMTTAEGVESEAQFRFLRDEGCDRVQGDYLSPPLEVESCSALFLAERDAAVPSAE
ncbi:MAG: bifunctional diguanylate cyclase/phosphodiesterase, partial [Pirellulaceae bacterium]|nr:bifunctional diguanylate cyclase/phosphodiesterase [Pirellulaceae bacterium]